MKARTLVVLMVLAALTGGGAYFIKSNQNVAQPQSEAVATHPNGLRLVAHGGCYGADCNGKNPSGLCDDGKTVAAMHVNYGMLELRYSPSCKSNWGRYTVYSRDKAFHDSQGTVIWPRVTVWNPGGASYSTAHRSASGSSWSQMVDGTKTACTGVEVYTSTASTPLPQRDEGWTWRQDDGVTSHGWQWGPCR